MKMPSERTRAYIYRVVVATLAILVLYGVLSGEELAEWAVWISVVLGLGEGGLAIANTSTKKEEW